MKIIAYVSEPSDPKTVEQLVADIDPAAKAKNRLLGVTGLLYYTGTHFLQVLEGPDNHIDELMATILQDPRHKNLNVVFEDAISSRSIADWSFRPLNLLSCSQLSISTLEKAINLTSHSMKLNAEGFIFMLNDLLNSPDFIELLESK